MISALLTTTLLPQRLPAEAPPTQIYASTPVFKATKGANPTLQIHGATVYLGIDESKVETLTLWHNPSTEPVEGQIVFTANSNAYSFSTLRNLKASWNKEPVTFRVDNVEKLGGYGGDGRILVTERIHAVIDVTMPARGTGALRMEFIQPNAKVGYGKDARQFVYRMPGFDARPEQYRLALKYSPEVVWRPITAESSKGKWEVGANGAYLKLDGMNMDRGATPIFQFYPKVD